MHGVMCITSAIFFGISQKIINNGRIYDLSLLTLPVISNICCDNHAMSLRRGTYKGKTLLPNPNLKQCNIIMFICSIKYLLMDKYLNFEVGLKCILMVFPYLLLCSYINENAMW